MNFFSQLRRLSVMVEREVADVQTSLDTPIKPERSPPDGSMAYLTLRKIQEDARKLKSDMFTTLEQLKGTNDFVPTVDQYVEKVNNQQKQIDQLEAYLVKYGYHPQAKMDVPTGPLRDGEIEEMDSLEVSGTTSVGNCDKEPVDTTSVYQSPKPCSASSVVQPRQRGSCSPPRLEDFGLSWEALDKYSTKKDHLQQQNQCRQKDSEGFLIPPLPTKCQPQGVSVTTTTTSIPRTWSSTESLPDDFKHHGLCVTPGLLGGHKTSACSPGVSVDYSAMSPDSLFVTATHTLECDSPVPPILTTPGVKQIEHLPKVKQTLSPPKMNLDEDSDSSPVPPTFTTPGLKPLGRISHLPAETEVPVLTFDEDDDDKSPVPPVLKTPGAKQIVEARVTQTSSEALPGSLDSGAPECPNLILDYGDITASQCSARTLHSTSSVNLIPATASLELKTADKPSASMAPLQAPAISGYAGVLGKAEPRSPELPSLSTLSMEDLEEPQMPELTRDYGFILKDLCPHPVPLKEQNNTKLIEQLASSVQSRVSQDGQGEDFNSTILELSGRHAHAMAAPQNKKTASLVTAASAFKSQDDAMPEMPVLSQNYDTSYNKENQSAAPKKPQTHCSRQNGRNSPVMQKAPSFWYVPSKHDSFHLLQIVWNFNGNLTESVCSLKHLTEQQYKTLPDYIQSCIPLEHCNSALRQLQELIRSKQEGGATDYMYLSHTDLEHSLQGKTTAFVLVMMKLSRLEKVTRGSGPAYLLS